MAYDWQKMTGRPDHRAAQPTGTHLVCSTSLMGMARRNDVREQRQAEGS